MFNAFMGVTSVGYTDSKRVEDPYERISNFGYDYFFTQF